MEECCDVIWWAVLIVPRLGAGIIVCVKAGLRKRVSKGDNGNINHYSSKLKSWQTSANIRLNN